jgi:release factor glutamine methyltransferase
MTAMPTYEQAWRASGLPALEAKMLLAHAAGFAREQLVLRAPDTLPAAIAQTYASLVARRLAGEPVAYLLGVREFYGRRFAVAPGVLIPRPETELLVELGLEKIAACWLSVNRSGRNLRVLELGVGSGAVIGSLALECADRWPENAHSMGFFGVDAATDALAQAAHNLARLGAAHALVALADLRQGDWFTPFAGERFDLIVSNPPYIAVGDAHLTQGDLRFEPAMALASGADGLEAIRHIVAKAPEHLQADGWLLLEHGHDQALAVRGLMQAAGLTEIRSALDLAGIERVTLGRANVA